MIILPFVFSHPIQSETRVHATGDNFENNLCGSLNCRLRNLIGAFIIQIEPGRQNYN